MPIVDIHPHVIATDNVRYPLQPLGGNQSTWSRDRPTTYDTMIEEMDKAGVAKSAIVQASTAYGHDNSYVAEAIAAHPEALHRRVLGRHARRRQCREDEALAGAGLLRHAAVHHRQHHAGPGDLVRRSAHLSGLASRQRHRHAGLHADDAAGLSAIARADRAVSQGEDHPRPSGAAATDRWAAVHRGPGVLRAVALSEYLSEAHAAQRRAEELGQGHAGNILRRADQSLWRQPHRLGIEFSGDRRTAEGNSRQGAAGARASPAQPTASGFSARPRWSFIRV